MKYIVSRLFRHRSGGGLYLYYYWNYSRSSNNAQVFVLWRHQAILFHVRDVMTIQKITILYDYLQRYSSPFCILFYQRLNSTNVLFQSRLMFFQMSTISSFVLKNENGTYFKNTTNMRVSAKLNFQNSLPKLKF